MASHLRYGFREANGSKEEMLIDMESTMAALLVLATIAVDLEYRCGGSKYLFGPIKHGSPTSSLALASFSCTSLCMYVQLSQMRLRKRPSGAKLDR
jgi:hypothetical protein